MTVFDPEKLIIRPMKKGDIDHIVEIDAKVLGKRRSDYYERKCAFTLDDKHQLITSLVAQYTDKVIGFIMGYLYVGEYGIPEATASLDTIGVHPDYQGKGVASELIKTYISNMKKAGVENIYMLIEWNNWEMLRLFEKFKFAPARTVNMELKLK
ncbi:MAG: GNAT family N-acetyltransferase [Pseudomonadota bacterium]